MENSKKMIELRKAFEDEGLAHEFSWVCEEENDPQKIHTILERRKQGEPLAYIFGHWSFWSMELSVGPGVLIPRPETEELAENIFQKVKAKAKFFPQWRIVDCGAGSGCLGLAIVNELLSQKLLIPEQVSLTLIERSAQAITFLRENLEALKDKYALLEEQVEIFEGSWTQWSIQEPVHVFLSNPPYISGEAGKNYDQSRDDADPDVRAFEPHDALYPKDLMSYPDASGPYRELLKIAAMSMELGAIGGFELGPAQAPWIETFVEENFPTLRGKLAKDIAGKHRFFYFERVA